MDRGIARKNTIRLCMWNANGIMQKKKKPELFNFIEDNNIDVCLIQETKLNPNNSLNMPNYQIYRTDRTTHHGGGTAILVRRSIPHNEEILISPPGMEVTSIKIRTALHRNLRIILAYNPPRNDIDKDSFLELFHASDPSILAGDLNAKNVSWHSRINNIIGRQLEDITASGNIYMLMPH